MSWKTFLMTFISIAAVIFLFSRIILWAVNDTREQRIKCLEQTQNTMFCYYKY